MTDRLGILVSSDRHLDYVVNTIDDIALVYENTLYSKDASKKDSIHTRSY